MCNFKAHNEGDGDSKSGFVWSRHSPGWVNSNKLDGPANGMKTVYQMLKKITQIVNLIERIVLILSLFDLHFTGT